MDVMPAMPSPWAVEPGAFPREGAEADRLRFLLRYAVLAPSTRNTQPWRFRVEDGAIAAYLDLARWQRVADADQREMYISLGCALENLTIAAAHFGYRTAVDCLAACVQPMQVARIRLMAGEVPAPSVGDPRFGAILHRYTNHGVYDGRPLRPDDHEAMRGVTVDPGLRVDWLDTDSARRAVDELVLRADALLFARPEYRQELADLIGTGAFGTPWLLAAIGRFAVAHLVPSGRLADADHRAIMSSPAIGVISAHSDTRTAQVRVGQVLERLYLEATVRGLSLQPVSQLLQTEETRAALQAMLPAPEWHPLQPFRVGYGKAPRAHTPRRAVEEVLLESGL